MAATADFAETASALTVQPKPKEALMDALEDIVFGSVS